jgi:carbon monoxide dehydrogenase subunit G
VKISGSVVVPHPVEAVWDAILDPAVLVRTIPGCSRLETVAENSYAMTVTAGVAAIKGTYDGTAVLSDLDPGKGLVMKLAGAGAPGTIGATVQVALASAEGGTEVRYDADAIVGGMVGGVGQRMLTSVSKRMAADFFGRIGEVIGAGPLGPVNTFSDDASGASGASGAAQGGRAMPERYVDAPQPGVFYPPKKGTDEFLRGIAVGAGLVLLGVVAGRLCRR